MSEGCPFCTLGPERIVAENDTAVAVRDNYPVTPGHTLIVPRRHVRSLFDLTPDAQAAVWALAARVRADVMALPEVLGVNIGVNDGQAAGQTVPHAHVHVIPRREGDVPDPRGGVRWVIPDKADYWSER